MLPVTPQERLALITLALLLAGGAVGRHVVARADAREWLEYTAASADTLNVTGSGRSSLRSRAEAELARQRIRDTPLAAGERVDPNTAPPEQLARLPRIGPALAERIVAHREANGGFRGLEDLRAVSGIGPALLEAIAPHVALSPARGGGQGGAAARVDVNRATAAELEALPGIGPAIAGRIVAYREVNGSFRSVAELENVSGIGPRLRERLEELVRLGP